MRPSVLAAIQEKAITFARNSQQTVGEDFYITLDQLNSIAMQVRHEIDDKLPS